MNKAENRFFVHPGFGKSGTTTFQNNLFGKHSELISIGKPYSDVNDNLKLREAIGKIDGIDYDETLAPSLVDKVLKQKNIINAKCIIYSDETLIFNSLMRATIAKRIKNIFPEANIIFTIRNQISAIESFYGYQGRILKDVPAPFSGRYVSLGNWLSYAFSNYKESFIGLIDYNTSIGIYEEIFGKDKIHVFLFEEFLNSRESFWKKISITLKINITETLRLMEDAWDNKKSAGRVVAYNRYREKLLPGFPIRKIVPFGNTIQRYFSGFLKKGSGIKVSIPEDWKVTLIDFYKDGNSELASHYSLPLAKYGYPL